MSNKKCADYKFIGDHVETINFVCRLFANTISWISNQTTSNEYLDFRMIVQITKVVNYNFVYH